MAAAAQNANGSKKNTLKKPLPNRSEWLRLDQQLQQSFEQSESEFSHTDDDSILDAVDSVLMSPSGHTGKLPLLSPLTFHRIISSQFFFSYIRCTYLSSVAARAIGCYKQRN